MNISYIISPPNGPVDCFVLTLLASHGSEFYKTNGWYLGEIDMSINNRAAWINAHSDYKESMANVTDVNLELPDDLSTEEVISHVILDFHGKALKSEHNRSGNEVASDMLKKYAKQMLVLCRLNQLNIPKDLRSNLEKYQEEYQHQSFRVGP